eukprot:3769978-Karenia_brevis.AAC.1
MSYTFQHMSYTFQQMSYTFQQISYTGNNVVHMSMLHTGHRRKGHRPTVTSFTPSLRRVAV